MPLLYVELYEVKVIALTWSTGAPASVMKKSKGRLLDGCKINNFSTML